MHGFRSTFRDWAGEATAHAREVIEAALAHRLKDRAEDDLASQIIRDLNSALAQMAELIGTR